LTSFKGGDRHITKPLARFKMLYLKLSLYLYFLLPIATLKDFVLSELGVLIINWWVSAELVWCTIKAEPTYLSAS